MAQLFLQKRFKRPVLQAHQETFIGVSVDNVADLTVPHAWVIWEWHVVHHHRVTFAEGTGRTQPFGMLCWLHLCYMSDMPWAQPVLQTPFCTSHEGTARSTAKLDTPVGTAQRARHLSEKGGRQSYHKRNTA